MCYYAEFGRFALKDVGIQKNPNMGGGALELHSLKWKAYVADLKIHAPPPRQIW